MHLSELICICVVFQLGFNATEVHAFVCSNSLCKIYEHLHLNGVWAQPWCRWCCFSKWFNLPLTLSLLSEWFIYFFFFFNLECWAVFKRVFPAGSLLIWSRIEIRATGSLTDVPSLLGLGVRLDAQRCVETFGSEFKREGKRQLLLKPAGSNLNKERERGERERGKKKKLFFLFKRDASRLFCMLSESCYGNLKEPCFLAHPALFFNQSFVCLFLLEQKSHTLANGSLNDRFTHRHGIFIDCLVPWNWSSVNGRLLMN